LEKGDKKAPDLQNSRGVEPQRLQKTSSLGLRPKAPNPTTHAFLKSSSKSIYLQRRFITTINDSSSPPFEKWINPLKSFAHYF
jgi:hypothetical protein